MPSLQVASAAQFKTGISPSSSFLKPEADGRINESLIRRAWLLFQRFRYSWAPSPEFVSMSDSTPSVPACDAELDASGLNCPLPLLKAKLELNGLPSGAVLKVTATDAGSQRDFRVFADLAGHSLLHEEVEAGVYRYWLRKK